MLYSVAVPPHPPNLHGENPTRTHDVSTASSTSPRTYIIIRLLWFEMPAYEISKPHASTPDLRRPSQSIASKNGPHWKIRRAYHTLFSESHLLPSLMNSSTAMLTMAINPSSGSFYPVGPPLASPNSPAHPRHPPASSEIRPPTARAATRDTRQLWGDFSLPPFLF